MREYWESIENKDNLERGMYLLLPLQYEERDGFQSISLAGEVRSFKSNDFIQLMNDKCRTDGNFVRRYQLYAESEPIHMDADISISDLELFVFYNGIAFLAVYLTYCNKDVDSLYKFIYPGYLSEPEEVKQKQLDFLLELENKYLKNIHPQMHWFMAGDGDLGIILKEAYRIHVAYVPNRFPDTDILNQITYNEHRIIDLSRDFKDLSEKDIGYVTGARDVNSEDYGWGCSVTSQEISLVYAQGEVSLKDQADDNLLLTMLAIYQKYSCLWLNEEIHKRHILRRDRNGFQKSIQELKWEAMEFVAYGTLEPSQISRWNNICEMYRLLFKMNGVSESIAEIKEKICLLNEEQEYIDSRRESYFNMLIAVFGLLSIIAAVLQIVDYLVSGEIEMLVFFIISCAGILAFGIQFLKIYWKKKKQKGDV